MEFRDFYEAYWWLYEHPIFQYEYDITIINENVMNSFFDQALDVDVVKVNPVNHTIEDNESLNTKTQVWIEVGGEYEQKYHCCQMHVWYLDTGGDTYEEAILNLANLVWKYYGNTDELIVSPYDEEDDDE